ncbi:MULTISPECIES: putative phage abortive infection protein [Bacillus]|uniref:putative phage abortive infection protein n=1 Tax=Bacillus TaxID=1386 RepID=UPI0009B566F4|nr:MULTISPECIES: putative phage abortive infection protein [Bacillus]MCC0758685.1 putative phage abortive infection protein [Bacillus sp. BRTN]MCC0770744.1 putative phage abortive infection protein [Bacillus pacificus]
MKKWLSKITNWMFIISMLCIVGAAASPLLVYLHYSGKGDYIGIAALGPIGDFVGGTTVTFLTAASVFLLIGTNIMQRKELQMSRKSVDEMVKQTEASVEQMAASVQQAEEARKETQITNETMKRQQFETTFFNMINLQHNILKEIQIGDYAGREAISKLYRELKNKYDGEVYELYKYELINNVIIPGSSDKLNDLIQKILIEEELSDYTQNFERYYVPDMYCDGELDFTRRDLFYKSITDETNREWNEIRAEIIQDFEENIKDDSEKCREILEKFDFQGDIEKEKSINHEYITEFKMNYFDNPLTELKHEAYETLYKKRENVIGHYYRNLYRIVKLIQKNVFDSESQEQNNEEKRKYRGILRAQLSSFELLMLFYNISYSEKGKKFKELIEGINFFDDHLIEEDFIWKNDVKELASLNASKGATETNSI